MDNNFKRQVDSLTILLEDWAAWQKGYSGARGYANHSVGLHSQASSTFMELCETVDCMVCESIDASVDDLPTGQKAAIHRRFGISAVFRFPRGNYEILLSDAYATLMITLSRKGVVI